MQLIYDKVCDNFFLVSFKNQGVAKIYTKIFSLPRIINLLHGLRLFDMNRGGVPLGDALLILLAPSIKIQWIQTDPTTRKRNGRKERDAERCMGISFILRNTRTSQLLSTDVVSGTLKKKFTARERRKCVFSEFSLLESSILVTEACWKEITRYWSSCCKTVILKDFLFWQISRQLGAFPVLKDIEEREKKKSWGILSIISNMNALVLYEIKSAQHHW